jgi:hypothetical protein
MNRDNPPNPPPLPVVLTAPDRYSFKRWVREDSWLILVVAICIVLLIFCLFWFLTVPLRAVSSDVDGFVTYIPFPGVFLVLTTLNLMEILATNPSRRAFRRTINILLFVICMTIFLIGALRSGARDDLLLCYDGIVTKKYISNNHAQPTISVTGKETIEIPINSLYHRVNIGDRLVKEPWSEYVSINGEMVKIYDIVSNRFLLKCIYSEAKLKFIFYGDSESEL